MALDSIQPTRIDKDGTTWDFSSANSFLVPTPTLDGQASTKAYVDSIGTGVRIKEAVRAKTVATLPAYTPAGSGVGKTLTADANGALPNIDDVTMVVGGYTGVVSLPGLILVDMNNARKADKDFKQRKKKLLGYNVKKIDKIKKKMVKNPKAYKTELALLGKSFIGDYASFRKAYTSLMKALIDTLMVANKEEYAELVGVKATVSKVQAGAKKNPSHYL